MSPAELERAKRSMAALKLELSEAVWIAHAEALNPVFAAAVVIPEEEKR